MDILIISLVTLFSALLTFFSGFGLGTILTPVMMIYFPAPLAIALTGLIHLFNNVFKLILVGKMVNLKVLLRFGIPAVLAAFVGSWILVSLNVQQVLFSYQIAGYQMDVYLIKFLISCILIIFVAIEFLPGLKNLKIEASYLPLGGIISGFFGGLSGNQGALRSAFLAKARLNKDEFVATTAVISTFVDLTRLSIYTSAFVTFSLSAHATLLGFAALAGILGTFLGNQLLKKVTIQFIQTIVSIALIFLAFSIGLGIL